jgi:hypothetical protein
LDFKQSDFCCETSISNVKFTEQMIAKGMKKKKFTNGAYWIMMKRKVVSQINDDDDDDEL